jgi:hypothetical protein
MPINPYLIDHSFDPEHVRAMGAAFENACRSLHLADGVDGASQAIASKIIEAANSGERDAVRLYDTVMQWACVAARADTSMS